MRTASAGGTVDVVAGVVVDVLDVVAGVVLGAAVPAEIGAESASSLPPHE
jgi:hypothetical protein